MEQARRHVTEKAQDNITLFHQMIVSAGDHNGKGQSVTNTGRCIIKPVGRQEKQCTQQHIAFAHLIALGCFVHHQEH